MENESGNGPYKKIGIGAGTLFILMMVGFFVFVFIDHRAPGDHALDHGPAAQIEEHAAPEDHATPDSPVTPDEHSSSDEAVNDHAASGDHTATDAHSDQGEKTVH